MRSRALICATGPTAATAAMRSNGSMLWEAEPSTKPSAAESPAAEPSAAVASWH